MTRAHRDLPWCALVEMNLHYHHAQIRENGTYELTRLI